MSEARPIIVKPTPGLTPEQALDARARAWRFIFDCHEKKAAAHTQSSDHDADGRSNELGATEDYSGQSAAGDLANAPRW